jgi:hypothetical protein
MGYPAWIQASKPPWIGMALEKPFSIKTFAARALDSSAGQVQYKMIQSEVSNSSLPSNSSSVIERAPGIWLWE